MRVASRLVLACCGTVVLLFVLGGCGESSRSQYTTHDILSRYDREGVERRDAEHGVEPAVEAPGVSQGAGPLNYRQCIDFALRNSPEITSGSVKLQLEDLSVEDAYTKMFPELKVNMTVSKIIYSEDSDDSSAEDTSMRLSFSSGTYDPFGAFISYEAAKVLRRVAVVRHMSAVDDLLLLIGGKYLEMEAMQGRIQLMEETDGVLSKVEDYYAALPASKASKPIELLEAQGRRKSTRLALERERVALKNTQVTVKMLVGADLTRSMDFDCAGTAGALLGSFRPDAVTLEEVKVASRELYISRLAKETSKYKIALARSEYIPTFSLGLQTPDPVASGSSVQRDYYGTLSMESPLLDWGRRERGVERGGIQAAASVHDLMVATKKVEAEYYKVRHDLELVRATDEYEASVVELNDLKHKKNTILFESGVISLPKLLMSEVDIINSRMAVIDAALERDLTLLSFKSVSGELFDSLVGEVTNDIR